MVINECYSRLVTHDYLIIKTLSRDRKKMTPLKEVAKLKEVESTLCPRLKGYVLFVNNKMGEELR